MIHMHARNVWIHTGEGEEESGSGERAEGHWREGTAWGVRSGVS
jgi:hypothetical protein